MDYHERAINTSVVGLWLAEARLPGRCILYAMIMLSAPSSRKM